MSDSGNNIGWEEVGFISGLVLTICGAVVTSPALIAIGATAAIFQGVSGYISSLEKDEQINVLNDWNRVIQIHGGYSPNNPDVTSIIPVPSNDDGLGYFLGIEKQVHDNKGIGWQDLNSGYYYWHNKESFKPKNAKYIWTWAKQYNYPFNVKRSP